MDDPSLVPRLLLRGPGTHCLRMRQIATAFGFYRKLPSHDYVKVLALLIQLERMFLKGNVAARHKQSMH